MLRSGVVLFLSAALMMQPALAQAAKHGKATAMAPIRQEVVLRHMLDGESQNVLTALVQRFNDEQRGQTRVVLQNVLEIEDEARRHLPAMALLEPDDSMLFFQSMPRFRPLHQVMSVAGLKLDAKQFFPLVADAVNDRAGRIQALPLGLSLPVLMWNKGAFRQAGMDPEAAPKTWFDVQTRAGSLYDAGGKCPLTSSRFAWIHLENVFTQQGEPLMQGEKGGPPRIRLNSMVGIKHLALLSSWYKSHYFQYFGPGIEADRKFLSGECGMITGESSLYYDAVQAGIDVGMSQMPFYDDMYGANQERILPGGMGLWPLAGRSKAEYRAVALFAGFMLRSDVQAEWLRHTGFLPMTPGALNLMKARGAPLPLVQLASRRLIESSPARTRIKHNFGLARLRAILGEEVATVWSNIKPAKEALDTAMSRANSTQLYVDDPVVRR